jgi:F-type H+-transporting ATPase subunit epsilon
VNLEILTPEKSLFKGKVQSVAVPGKKGSFMILRNHAPIISTLSKGKIDIVTRDYKEESLEISGGVIEVKDNTIIVLADI